MPDREPHVAAERTLLVGRDPRAGRLVARADLDQTDRCINLPSIRDLAWVTAHFGHR